MSGQGGGDRQEEQRGRRGAAAPGRQEEQWGGRGDRGVGVGGQGRERGGCEGR